MATGPQAGVVGPVQLGGVPAGWRRLDVDWTGSEGLVLLKLAKRMPVVAKRQVGDVLAERRLRLRSRFRA